jgi:hypothetical protein
MTRRSAVLVALFISLPAAAGAQTVYWTDRPIAMPKGKQEVNIDLSVGLNKGALGEDFGLAAGLAGDRYSGLHFRAGVWTNLEMGLALQFAYSMHKGDNYSLRGPIPADETRIGRFATVSGVSPGIRPPRLNAGPEGDGTRRIAGYPYHFGMDEQSHLNPLTIYARYAIVPQFGLELALIIPIEELQGGNRPAFRLGMPFRWILSPGLLSIHVQPDLLVGFAKSGNEFWEPKGTVLVSYYVDAGITFALLGAFLDVTLGYGGDAFPYKRGYFPLSIQVGYTILPRWDIYVGVSLDNLLPESGGAADSRRLTLGNSVRF